MSARRFLILFLLLCLSVSGCCPATENITGANYAPSENKPEVQDPSTFFSLKFLDVGHADAAIIICDGKALLIDGGNAEDGSTIYAFLRNLNISHLDYVISTHPHEDHVGGLIGPLHFVSVGTVYSPVTSGDTQTFNRFLELMAEKEVEITVPSPGDAFQLGSATVTFFGPIEATEDINNMSLVFKVEYGSQSVLFTGDASVEEEAQILAAGYDISCDVLKVGHHGISDSSSPKWLWEADPDFAVISVGAENTGGFPSEEVLYSLDKLGSTICRTDLLGHLSFSFTPSEITYYTAPSSEVPYIDVTHICNLNTNKFHLPSCPCVEDIASWNILEVDLLRGELMLSGFSPCEMCIEY